MLYNPYTCFGRTDEIYLGTWFGYDAWAYLQSGSYNILLAEGNEGGEYRTWVGGEHWFFHDAQIGTPDGPIPIVDHLTQNKSGLAYLMAFAALHHYLVTIKSEKVTNGNVT